MPQAFSPNTVSKSEIVTIQRTHPNCWTIRYEWSDDLDPDGRICSIEWRLTFKDALEAAQRQLMFNTRIPGLKPSMPSESIPSCFNCHYVKMWHHAATREDPEESGWECAHPDPEIAIQDMTPSDHCLECNGNGLVNRETTASVEPEVACRVQGIDNDQCSCVRDDETIARLIAIQCPGYEAQKQEPQDSDLPFELLSPEQIEELAILEAEVQQTEYLGRGWITSIGELTPHYFEAAQRDYDINNGK